MAISFRKQSLAKLASPDQLDTPIGITTPAGWMALGTVGFCLAVALAWGVWGRIPTQLTGTGLLLNPGGLLAVHAPSGGIIETLAAQRGQLVSAGDVLATIGHPNEQQAVIAAQDKVRELQRVHALVRADQHKSQQRKKHEMESAGDGLRLNIQNGQRRIARLDARIANQQALVGLGLMTQYELSETLEARESTQNQVASDRNRLIGIQNDYAQFVEDQRHRLKELANEVEQARDALAIAQARLDDAQVIAAAHDGIVVGISTVPGARVAAGDELLTLDLLDDPDDRSLQALQYYPAATAKRIKEGMSTRIAPGTVKVDQFGYLLARVTRVAEFPATTAQLRARLQNDEMVRKIEEHGAVLEVESVLLEDPATASGYRWTSRQGPPYALQAGTPCTTSVVVEEVPPAGLVIPLLKKHLLGVGEERP